MSSRTESPPSQPDSLRRGVSRRSTAGLLLGWAACVLLLVYLLEVRPRQASPPRSADTDPALQAAFPAPPQGAVVFSRRLGSDALALGVVPGSEQVVLQASVVGPQGAGVPNLDVAFGAGGTTAPGRSCGDGCYRAVLPADVVRGSIEVTIENVSSTIWRVPLPKPWPPRNAAPLVGRAERTWRSLRSLSFEETLASGQGRVVRSSWTVAHPNRLTYEIVGGASAVIVGNRRWDRTPGKPWEESSQPPIRQPTPPWAGVRNASIVGTTTVRGRPAFVVTFFDPKTPGWFRIVVDRATFRTYDVRMTATAHFMRDRFHSFDGAPPIRPPTSG